MVLQEVGGIHTQRAKALYHHLSHLQAGFAAAYSVESFHFLLCSIEAKALKGKLTSKGDALAAVQSQGSVSDAVQHRASSDQRKELSWGGSNASSLWVLTLAGRKHTPVGFFRSVMADAQHSEALQEIVKASICKNNFS